MIIRQRPRLARLACVCILWSSLVQACSADNRAPQTVAHGRAQGEAQSLLRSKSRQSADLASRQRIARDVQTKEPVRSQSTTTSTSDSFLTLDNAFRAAYLDSKQETLTRIGPVIITGGGKIVLLRSGKRTEVQYIPPTYHVLKTIDHVPLALFVLLRLHTDSPLDDAFLGKLRQFRELITTAGASLDDSKLPPDMLARQHTIIDRSLSLVDKTCAGRKVTNGDLDAFTGSIGSLLLANADYAVRMELDGLDAQVTAWQHEMTSEEWNSLHVIVMDVHMARQQDRSMQYFSRRLGECEEGRRLIFLEGSQEEPQALDLLATHVLDGAVGKAFFGDPMRMHRDFLSDAARHWLDEHPLQR